MPAGYILPVYILSRLLQVKDIKANPVHTTQASEGPVMCFRTSEVMGW